jgi:glycogen synthase
LTKYLGSAPRSVAGSAYDQNSLAEKAKNKQQLQTSLGLKADDRALLFTVVSRLTSQKGLDLLLARCRELYLREGSWRYWDPGTRICRPVF